MQGVFEAMTFDRESGRPVPIGSPTWLTAAGQLLDGRRVPGFIRFWSHDLQGHVVVLERDDQGHWWRTNPYTGQRERTARP